MTFDLVLLDVQLPDGSGFDFCGEIRRQSDIPIIFLTASDQEHDIVRGLDLGGDDYITKPFRLREFLSRVQAVLRRQTPTASAAGTLRAGGIALFAEELRVRKNGRDIPLSLTEFRLLSLFLGHPRAVLSKEQLLRHGWPDGAEVLDDNTVAVNIRRLREKLEDDPQHPQLILTVRGAGYRSRDARYFGEDQATAGRRGSLYAIRSSYGQRRGAGVGSPSEFRTN